MIRISVYTCRVSTNRYHGKVDMAPQMKVYHCMEITKTCTACNANNSLEYNESPGMIMLILLPVSIKYDLLRM